MITEAQRSPSTRFLTAGAEKSAEALSATSSGCGIASCPPSRASNRGAILFDGMVSIPTEQLFTRRMRAPPQTERFQNASTSGCLKRGYQSVGTNNLATSIAGAMRSVYTNKRAAAHSGGNLQSSRDCRSSTRQLALHATIWSGRSLARSATQDNVFSVWTVGQAIKKRRGRYRLR